MFDACVRVIYKSIEQDTFMRFKLTGTADSLVGQIPSIGKNERRSSSETVASQASLVSAIADSA